jgi:hypothetical protein
MSEIKISFTPFILRGKGCLLQFSLKVEREVNQVSLTFEDEKRGMSGISAVCSFAFVGKIFF